MEIEVEEIDFGKGWDAAGGMTPSTAVGGVDGGGEMTLKNLNQLLLFSMPHPTESEKLRSQTTLLNMLRNLTSLEDLSTALHSIARDRYFSETPEVLTLCLAIAVSRLNLSTREATDANNNPRIIHLKDEINFYERLIDVWGKIEKLNRDHSTGGGANGGSCLDGTEPEEIREAVGWFECVEEATHGSNNNNMKIKFHQLPTSITFSPTGLTTFSNTPSLRQPILTAIFAPVISDVFALKPANEIFEVLRMDDQLSNLQKWFAEFFLEEVEGGDVLGE